MFARGNARAAIYRDDADRNSYLHLLGKVTDHCGLGCLAYCLMDNHVHLLVETPRANLSTAMQLLHGSYANGFNKRYRRPGHLFQGRYGAVRTKDDRQLAAVAGYIARNPVEARLCERPEDWPWNSYAMVMDGNAPPWLSERRLLEVLGKRRAAALERYAELGSMAPVFDPFQPRKRGRPLKGV